MRKTFNTKFATGGWADNLGNIMTGGLGVTLLATGNPAGLGMLASSASGFAANAKAARDQKVYEQEQQKLIDYNINNRNYYNNNTTMNRTMFAFGGRATGGMMPVSSTEQIAVGPNHEQGGIQTSFGEVEGQEVIRQDKNGTSVYSDDLGYAQPAQQLSIAKGQLEKQLQSVAQQMAAYEEHIAKLNSSMDDPKLNKFERNKIKREYDKIGKAYIDIQENADAITAQIQNIDTELQQLMQQQEQQATAMGLRDENGMPVEGEQPMFATGGRKAYNSQYDVSYSTPGGNEFYVYPLQSFNYLNAPPIIYRNTLSDGTVAHNQTSTPNTKESIYNSSNNIPTQIIERDGKKYYRGYEIPEWAYSDGVSNDTIANIKEVQNILKAQGLYDGNIDGLWGEKSKTAYDDYMALENNLESNTNNRPLNVNNLTSFSNKTINGRLVAEPFSGATLGVKFDPKLNNNRNNTFSNGHLITSDSIEESVESSNKSNERGTINIDNYVPYISNLVNAGISLANSNRTLPRIRRQSTPTLNANIVNDFSDIDSVVAASNEYLQSNVSNAAVGRANSQMINNNAGRARTSLRANNENISRQTRNQNLAMSAQIDSQNIQNDFINQQIVDKNRTDLATQLSANIANIESKMTQLIEQGRMEEYQQMQIDLIDKYLSGNIPFELNNIILKTLSLDKLKLAMKERGINEDSDTWKQNITNWEETNNARS